MAKDYDVLNGLTSKTQELHREIFDKGYEQGKADVLDKIRAEIDGAEMPKNRMSFFRDGINCALEVIDKYREVNK